MSICQLNKGIRVIKSLKLEPDAYVCYILFSTVKARTYVGSTNNMVKRFKQHNGFMAGGAVYTKSSRPWEVGAVVSGFRNRKQALQFEWALKHCRGKGKGARRRKSALTRLLVADKWTSKACEAATVPLRVCTVADDMHFNEEEMADVGANIIVKITE